MLICLRPCSPSFESAWRAGTSGTINCMTIDDVMYGYTPIAATLMLASAPPLKMFMKPSTVLCLNAWSSAAGSTPGTGTLEMKRKMTMSANVNSSFSRMSGWAIALTAAWSSCGLCGCSRLPAAAIAFAFGGFGRRTAAFFDSGSALGARPFRFAFAQLDDGTAGCFDLLFGRHGETVSRYCQLLRERPRG